VRQLSLSAAENYFIELYGIDQLTLKLMPTPRQTVVKLPLPFPKTQRHAVENIDNSQLTPSDAQD
jgi:hypothetical protein